MMYFHVPLPRDFYLLPTVEVAQKLLGHYLIRRVGEETVGGVIVETEAYLVGDPACHAYLRETPRNRTMWAAPGFAYVYQIYGAHYCFNAVCQPAGTAEAVLVRAIEPTFGLATMQQWRVTKTTRELTNGPAKFCAAMNIDRALDGTDLCDPASPILITHNPHRDELLQRREPMVTTTRIGITRAADWPLRFYLQNSDYVSRRVLKGHASTFSPAPRDALKDPEA